MRQTITIAQAEVAVVQQKRRAFRDADSSNAATASAAAPDGRWQSRPPEKAYRGGFLLLCLDIRVASSGRNPKRTEETMMNHPTITLVGAPDQLPLELVDLDRIGEEGS